MRRSLVATQGDRPSGCGVRGRERQWTTPLFLLHFLVLEVYGGRDGEVGIRGRERLLEVLQRLRQEVLWRKDDVRLGQGACVSIYVCKQV